MGLRLGDDATRRAAVHADTHYAEEKAERRRRRCLRRQDASSSPEPGGFQAPVQPSAEQQLVTAGCDACCSRAVAADATASATASGTNTWPLRPPPRRRYSTGIIEIHTHTSTGPADHAAVHRVLFLALRQSHCILLDNTFFFFCCTGTAPRVAERGIRLTLMSSPSTCIYPFCTFASRLNSDSA